jgi:hypothetical protein
MKQFIDILSPEIEDWPEIIEETKPFDIFIASALNKDGPVHLYPSVWKNPLETILRDNFHSSGTTNPVWTIYLCLGRVEESLEPASDIEVKKEPGLKGLQGVIKHGSSKSRIKKEKSIPTIKKETIDGEILDLISRKRSFSDINRDLDDGITQINGRLRYSEGKAVQEALTTTHIQSYTGSDEGVQTQVNEEINTEVNTENNIEDLDQETETIELCSCLRL